MGGFSGNDRGGVRAVSQFNGDSQLVPTCWLCVGRWLKKKQCHLTAFLSWPEMPLHSSPWSQTIQLLPIYLWCFSSCCLCTTSQNKWVHHKYVYGPFKITPRRKRLTPGNLEAVHLTQQNICWCLKPDVVGTPVPCTGDWSWGAQCGAGTLALQGGTLQLRYFF